MALSSTQPADVPLPRTAPRRGFLDVERVKGKAEVVYFSYDRDAVKPFAWLTDVRWNRIGDRIK